MPKKEKKQSLLDEEKEDVELIPKKDGKTDKKDKQEEEELEPIEYDSSYCDLRSNRMYIFGTLLFLLNLCNFICQTYTDYHSFKDIEQYDMYHIYGYGKLISSGILTFACLLLFYLQKIKNTTNNDDNGCSCCSIRGFTAILLVFGGLLELAQTILGIIASIKATSYAMGNDWSCMSYVKQEVWKFERDATGTPKHDTEERNVGVQICSIPIAYEMILSLLPIMMGFDILFTKCFSKKGKCCCFNRLTMYSLVIIISCFSFFVFLGSVLNYCNVFDKAFDKTIKSRGSAYTTDLDYKCKRDLGWFPPSFNYDEIGSPGLRYWGGPGNSSPEWLPNEIGKTELMFTGFVMMGVGAILALLTSIISVTKLSCGKNIPLSCLNCKCNEKDSISCMQLFIGLLIIIGSIFIFIMGQSMGTTTGYLGYAVSIPTNLASGTRPYANVFPKNIEMYGSIFCFAVPYLYWFLWLSLGIIVGSDVFNIGEDSE